MTDLAELIARVEKAGGPDRELDGRIYCSVYTAAYTDETPEERQTYAQKNGPRYTSSIDAALTLVPEGWGWDVGDVHPPSEKYDDGGLAWCEIWKRGTDNVSLRGAHRTAYSLRNLFNAATPALALCIAALRTRSAL